MNERERISSPPELISHSARRVSSQVVQNTHAPIERITKQRFSAANSRPSPPLSTSQLVSNRYMPLSRMIAHPSGISPFYPGKRTSNDYNCDMNMIRKFPRTADKSKGLRHFSTKVADELVSEYFDSADVQPTDTEKQQYDMKNIRRRVYDALNVLMAMNIIEKERKEIRWVGLPTSSLQECRKLEEEKVKRKERIRHKCEQLQELIIQANSLFSRNYFLIVYKTLVEKNREMERDNGRPREDSILYLPFIIVSTAKKTFIDCAISHDKTEYLFNFDQPFEIHDDIEVLKRLGLAYGLERGEVSDANRIKIKSYLPLSLRSYIDQIIDGTLSNAYDNSRNVVPAVDTTHDRHAVYALASSTRMGHAAANTPHSYQVPNRGTLSSVRVTSAPVLPRTVAVSSSHHTDSNSKYIPSSSGYRTVRIPVQQYSVQPGPSSSQQKALNMNRQVAYNIQDSGRTQLSDEHQYEEVYDEEENLNYQ
ncbi:unnamed protein product [Thelazia callipaeda]|uniref:Transcription factor Dp-2 n=1 Tax=Thelazia callipaeda TaxID=103827 RepID=A0A0N5CW47_THECL|nr:unnamed protein product [Thelazia callipaeda]